MCSRFASKTLPIQPTAGYLFLPLAENIARASIPPEAYNILVIEDIIPYITNKGNEMM
jgi:hypothetical protein